MAEDFKCRVSAEISGTILNIGPGDIIAIVVNGVTKKTTTLPAAIPGFVQGKAESNVRFVLGFDTSLMTQAQKAGFLAKLADGTLKQTEETSS